MKKYLFVENHFSASAKALRAEFDARFDDPKRTNSNRFVWDFWHVPDQYTLARTPADYFFSKKIYQQFLRELGQWGQENLGCSSITPPWLSYYIEGCEQKLHSDVPHGPWAFVFSLCPKRIHFNGGETLLLKPSTLQYWKDFSSVEDRELNSFVDRITPNFNRLVVFDPRIPHGVTRVSGTMDPREARLVLHGWFTDPKPFLKGSLNARQVAPILDEAVEKFCDYLGEFSDWHGVLSIRFFVRANGSFNMKILANSLTAVNPIAEINLNKLLRKCFGKPFPKSKSGTEITLPLLFR